MTAFFITPLSALKSKWRIFYEESVDLNPRDEKSDFEELRGVLDSRIYRHGQTTLAVSSDNERLRNKIRKLPGLAPKTGSVFLFPDALLDMVAQFIKARKSRRLSPRRKAALVSAGSQWRFGHLKPTIG